MLAVNSVQILLSSSLLSKSKIIEIYRTVIVRVVLCECETWPFTLKKDHEDQRVREYATEEDIRP
jgi:hypothetical protein